MRHPKRIRQRIYMHLVIALLQPDRRPFLYLIQIRFVPDKRPDIVDLVFDHSRTFQRHTPTKNSDPFRKAHGLEHLGAENTRLKLHISCCYVYYKQQ